jgi:hypothetical protein
MARDAGDRPLWRRILEAITRRTRRDLVVPNAPVTPEDIRRVQELDAQYGWGEFREER